MILYVEIRSSWGKYEELAQYLARNISREEYFSREIFLARNIPCEVLDQILTQIFSSQGMKNLWGIFLARNIPREEYSSREIISRGFLWGICEELQRYLD